MKKPIFILIISFLWRVESFAQGDFTRIYHPIINEAELAIVDTNYNEALDFYKEAFVNVKKPFAKDYYNAAICASMVGKLSLTFDYLEKIVEKGYPFDSLRRDVFFHYVADTCKRWNDFEKQMKLVKPNINKELRDSLKRIYMFGTKEFYTPITTELRDYIKTNYKEKWLPVDSLILMSGMSEALRKQRDSIQKINEHLYSQNLRIAYQKTIQILDMNGYPDENIIGLSGRDARLINTLYRRSLYTYSDRNHNDAMFNNNIVLDLLSNTFPTDDKNIMPLIIQSIRDGKVLPHQINRVISGRFNTNTRVFENSSIYEMGKVQIFQYKLEGNLICNNKFVDEQIDKKFWRKENFQDYSEAEINEKRQEIGLEKLADAYKKAFFKAHPTPFIINGGNYQKELSYISSCEVLEKMLKESVSVK